MPISPKALRVGFALTAAALLLAVVGFYGYAKYRVRKAIQEVPKQLGVNVQQSASGFKISKSEGGRMLFSLSAANAVQYKGSQKASLQDARIIVYNRGKGTNDPQTDIYDQIYGKKFDYDHVTGEVKATGEVMIDLQAKGTPPSDPTETTSAPSALHLKTSGLTFNEKSGIAETDQKIEFALPQGRGAAMGALYDSKLMTIHLKSDVRLQTAPPAKSGQRSGLVTITAHNADLFDMPREAILSDVHMEDEPKTRSISAGRLTISLRGDNTIESALASEKVTASFGTKPGDGGTEVQAAQAIMAFADGNSLKSAVLKGDVKVVSKGKEPVHASAGKAELEFASKSQLVKVLASQNVILSNSGEPGRADGFTLNAPAVDFLLKPGNRLDKAVTRGAAQIVLDSQPGSNGQKSASHTVATADKFQADFASGGRGNRMEKIRGWGNTRVVSSSAGNPDRTTTGKELALRFDVKTGGVSNVEQSGDFKYVEGPRTATSEKAMLDMVTDELSLSGAPRVQDAGQGFTLTANSIRMNRKTGDLEADGAIKATYNQPKSGASGAMFSGQGGEPVHATSQKMTANNRSGTAKFIGNARLWQGANLVEAPQITFDRDHRQLVAESAAASGQRVETAFVQTQKNGKVTPVSVVAGKLVYSDIERKARFEGGVRVKSADMTMMADHADVFLKAKAGGKESASEIERIEAEGQMVLEEQNPVRRVTGGRLVYTADEGKFVMTGQAGKMPSIFDAERGNVTGDSLTFYMHDDRVQIGSGENSRVVTRTRIKDERKP